ncbi:MAG TPA: hypothetical protein ENJ32_12620 [Crenotrichaceae bacterium]|nr:hypothetical protein [Crenotrichaceae bacterium]
MKLFLSIVLVLLMSAGTCIARNKSVHNNTIYPVNYDVSDVATEIVLLRPLGFVGSIVGTAVFLGTLPLSLFASITPPHDIIHKAAKTLIVGPANATFQRPFAYYHYDPVGNYPTVIKH